MPNTILTALIALLCLAFTNNQSPAVSRAVEQPLKAAVHVSSSNLAATSLTKAKFEEGIKALYDRTGVSSYGLEFDVFRLAMIGYYGLRQQGALSDTQLITIINFALPSTQERFFTIDLKNEKVKYHTYVAHGRNTGQNMATEFSNIPHSNQSSLGFYVTGETYVGSKGYSLRLDGMEDAFNGNIRSRAVVVHAAEYVTKSWIQRYGRLGRSEGCPALPPAISRRVIDAIKNKTAIFTYFPDTTYLNNSTYLQLDNVLRGYGDENVAALFSRATSRS